MRDPLSLSTTHSLTLHSSWSFRRKGEKRRTEGGRMEEEQEDTLPPPETHHRASSCLLLSTFSLSLSRKKERENTLRPVSLQFQNTRRNDFASSRNHTESLGFHAVWAHAMWHTGFRQFVCDAIHWSVSSAAWKLALA